LVVSQGEAVAAFAFLFELRVLGTSSEEIFEGCAELDNRHLWSVFGDFQHPRELFAFDSVELFASENCEGLGRLLSLFHAAYWVCHSANAQL